MTAGPVFPTADISAEKILRNADQLPDTNTNEGARWSVNRSMRGLRDMRERKKNDSQQNSRPRPGFRFFASLLATLMVAATLAGGIATASVQAEECFGSGDTLADARSDFADRCSEPRVDCDPIDDVWYCSDHVIGAAAPNGNDGPPSTLDPSTDPVTNPDPDPAPTPDPEPQPTPDPSVCSATASTLAQARAAYADSCTLPRADCDPVQNGWTCSSEQIGAGAPGGETPNDRAADHGTSDDRTPNHRTPNDGTPNRLCCKHLRFS